MSDLVPSAVTGLEGLAKPGRIGPGGGPAGVTLALRPQPALASVIARRGARGAVVEAARTALGLEPPEAPKVASAGTVAMIWAGPDQWLAMSDGVAGHDLEARLRSVFSGTASVSDQSDGRVILRIGGTGARDALAKGLPIDLHPEAFVPGQTAISMFGYIGIQIWQVDASPTYDIAVARSYAADLWRALAHASAGYGLRIEG